MKVFFGLQTLVGIYQYCGKAQQIEVRPFLSYMETIMAENRTEIVPAAFPELQKLVWNRDPLRPLPAEEAFAIYDRNWRFVDQDELTKREAELIRSLGRQYGHGFGLM